MLCHNMEKLFYLEYLLKVLENIFASVGHPVIKLYSLLESFGKFVLFQLTLFTHFYTVFKRKKLIAQQIETIGYGTLGVVTLTALFTGMVEAIQLYDGFHQFGVENFMGYTIFASITKELGPVFASLMLISRAVSAMAAELGTMRVTEQIDAIDILGIDSRYYLILPRIVATMISLPLLVLWFDVVAVGSAYGISTVVLDVNPTAYQETLTKLGEMSDVFSGVLKGFVFAYLISAIGTYIGYHTTGGARGVGRSTISAVVYSSISIFIANYFISSLLLFLKI